MNFLKFKTYRGMRIGVKKICQQSRMLLAHMENCNEEKLEYRRSLLWILFQELKEKIR